MSKNKFTIRKTIKLRMLKLKKINKKALIKKL